MLSPSLRVQFVNDLESVVAGLQFRSSEDTVHHLYWCADCKTPGCKQRQVFKDVPFDNSSSDEPTVHFNFPASFQMRCRTCGATHVYKVDDIDDFNSGDSLPLGFDVLV